MERFPNPNMPEFPEIPFAPVPEVLPPGVTPLDSPGQPPAREGASIDHSDEERLREWNQLNQL